VVNDNDDDYVGNDDGALMIGKMIIMIDDNDIKYSCLLQQKLKTRSFIHKATIM